MPSVNWRQFMDKLGISKFYWLSACWEFPEGASTVLPKDPADCWNWPINSRRAINHSDGF